MQRKSPSKPNEGAAVRMLRRLVPVSLLRYGIVGILQNAFFYLVALGLVALGMQAWQTIAVLNPVAVAITFLANRAWSFEDRERRRGQFLGYAFTYGAAYLAAVALTWTLERAGVAPWLALLVTIFVSAAGIFLALNFWVFRDRTGGRPAARKDAGPS